MIREIEFFENHFIDFYEEQNKKVQEKIEYVFRIVRNIPNIPKKFLTKITDVDGLFEMRIEYGNNIYRIFSCFDEGNLVILFNGFQKKTQKTPKTEIDRAKRLMKKYFKNKKDKNGDKKS